MAELFVLGTIYPEPETDEFGDAIPGQDPLPGYHVNTTEEILPFKAFRINPKAPTCLVGGANTCFYKFASEAQFLEKLGLLENPILVQVSL